jgi:hypothetical protein
MNAMTGAIGAARACAGREHASRNRQASGSNPLTGSQFSEREFTSYTSSKIPGAALNILLTSTVTPKTTAATSC